MAEQQVRLEEQPDRLVFTNGRIIVEVGKQRGEWLSFSLDGHTFINYQAQPQVPVDFRVDGEWKIEQHGCSYIGFWVEKRAEQTALHVQLGVQPIPSNFGVPLSLLAMDQSGRFEYQVTCTYLLKPDDTVLQQQMRVQRNQNKDEAGVRTFRFEKFLFKLPGVIVGDESNCTVEMPGPVVEKGILKPRLSYQRARTLYFSRRTAPDFDLGIVLLNNPQTGLTLSTWHETVRTCYRQHLAGNGESLTVATNEEYAAYLLDGGERISHVNTIRLSMAGIAEALRSYANYIVQAAPPLKNPPAWLKNAVFLEVDTAFLGGFSGLREKLSYFQSIGINALYLIPINEGSYLISDHYKFDPALGTDEDLKAMVAEAHCLGMKVLFDLLITITTRDSMLVKTHPEYFQRDAAGRITPHFKWSNAATDPANPGFRQYIVDFATYCVREFQVDGFRVDAASANTPNWYPHNEREPWETTMSSYLLMEEVNFAIKRLNPDAILLDELGGPAFFHVSDICHNFGFINQLLWEKTKADDYYASDYQTLLADMQAAMPPQVLRVFYTRNHDTAWFSHFDGYTPEFMCYEAMHTLIKGIPLFFAGQKGHSGPSEEDYAFYQKLLSLRVTHPILIEGECYYDRVESDQRQVFCVLRTDQHHLLICIVSTSPEPLEAKIHIRTDGLASPEGPVTLVDLLDGENSMQVDSLNCFTISLRSYSIHAFKVDK